MSWKWAQGRRLLVRLKAPVISGGDSNSCEDSAPFPVFPKQLRGDAEGGAGSGGVGRGRVGPGEAGQRVSSAPLGLWACASQPDACVETLRCGRSRGKGWDTECEGPVMRNTGRDSVGTSLGWKAYAFKIVTCRTTFVEPL